MIRDEYRKKESSVESQFGRFSSRAGPFDVESVSLNDNIMIETPTARTKIVYENNQNTGEYVNNSQNRDIGKHPGINSSSGRFKKIKVEDFPVSHSQTYQHSGKYTLPPFNNSKTRGDKTEKN